MLNVNIELVCLEKCQVKFKLFVFIQKLTSGPNTWLKALFPIN